MKRYRILLFFINLVVIISFSNPFNAQTTHLDISTYSTYKIPVKNFPEYKLKVISQEFLSIDLTTNPGIGQSDYLKSVSCISCNIDEIDEVYIEIYEWKEDADVNLGVLVKKYTSQDAILKDLENMKRSDNTIYFYHKNYLLLFWSEQSDEKIQEDQFRIIEKYYTSKGFKRIDDKLLKESEFEWVDFSDSTFIKEKNVQVASARKIKYLFSAEGGFIVFYDDGTVTVCGDCVLCKENVDKMSVEKPYSIYEIGKDRIMMHSPDLDVNEPYFFEFHDNADISEWYILDYKILLTIPESCK